MSNKRALFLDLDGTVREPKSENKFINIPQDQKIIDGVSSVIEKYADYLIFGIANQDGVAHGYKTIADTIAEQQITLDLIPQMKLILFCPDLDGKELYVCSGFNGGVKVDFEEQLNSCSSNISSINSDYDSFRKPGIGMVQYLLNSYSIDKYNSLSIGDMDSDAECAANAGIQFLHAEEWRNNSNLLEV